MVMKPEALNKLKVGIAPRSGSPLVGTVGVCFCQNAAPTAADFPDGVIRPGALWFDTSVGRLKVWGEVVWIPIN